MLDINAKNYINAGVHVLEVTNRPFFGVRMCDLQNGIGVKNMSDLARKKIQGIFETKNPTEEQIRKYKRVAKKVKKKRRKKNNFRIKLGLNPNDIIYNNV